MEARKAMGRPQEGSGKIAADGWGHCGWCSQDRAGRPGGYARLERAVGGKEGSAEGHGPGTQKEVLLAASPAGHFLCLSAHQAHEQCWESGVRAGTSRTQRVGQGRPETSCVHQGGGIHGQRLSSEPSAVLPGAALPTGS